MSDHLIRPNKDSVSSIHVSPQSAGWKYLSFSALSLGTNERYHEDTTGVEVAIVPLQGAGVIRVANQTFHLSRKNVFEERSPILYVPPGHQIEVTTENDFEFAAGSAPAEGRYPLRLFTPEEMKSEVRGGGAAVRQVIHSLAYPLPAERLILFEVYVPGGAWSGWPPHCHDGYMGSPYLEEIYYYRINPEDGVAFHRNYRLDNNFDEILPATHGSCVLVTEGFHPVAAAPGSNVYFLNYLAGELEDGARNYKPYDDPSTTWITENWDANLMKLPLF